MLLQERQTLSSVMHPLTQQLVHQYYTIDGTEEADIECSIKDVVLTELTEKYYPFDHRLIFENNVCIYVSMAHLLF